MKNRHRIAALILTLGGLGAACSSSEATRADLIDELMSGDAAMTEDQANCVADGVEDAGISYDVVDASVDEVSDEDVETLTSVMFDCLLGS